MNSLVICRYPWISVILFLGWAQSVSAFSLGAIDVKSDFGERFEAEIVVGVDDERDARFSIGDLEDYDKLELARQEIVDALKVDLPLKNRDGKMILRLYSEKPLFYPSFNLVVRATHQEGTLLENYLITVDFKQSLALRLKDKEKDADEKKLRKPDTFKTADLLKGDKESPEPSGKTPTTSTPEPSPSSETSVSPVKPAPLIGQSKPRRPGYGALWASPKDRQTPGTRKDDAFRTVTQRKEVSSGEPMIAGQATAPFKWGDTLLTVAKKLNRKATHSSRVAVALWLGNKEKFIDGNMNGVQTGTVLSLENFEDRLASLDVKTAEEILASQWEEWKVIRKKRISVNLPEEILPGDTRLDLVPAGKDTGAGKIFNSLRVWRSSWQERDLEGHMALFSNGPNYTDLRAFKKRMFDLHQGIQVDASRSVLIRTLEGARVVFDQGFESTRMESVGNKTIDFEWRDEVWQIENERFEVRQFHDKRKLSPFSEPAKESSDLPTVSIPQMPYVVHVSSHLDLPTALGVVRELRNKGLDAYLGPVYVAGARKIYRVYVGRFPDWISAQSISRSLRALKGLGRFAVPQHAPFTLEIASFKTEGEAVQYLNTWKYPAINLFVFVTSEKNFKPVRFQIFSGAFEGKEDAQKYSEALRKVGVSNKPVAP